jgi:MFS family permease
VVGAGLLVLVAGSFAAAVVASWSLGYAMAAAVLGMGASGVRLGAEVALIRWVGRDRAAVGAALGETTMLGGRAIGAPAVGVLADTRGGSYAFYAIGLAGLALAGLFAARKVDRRLRLAFVRRAERVAEQVAEQVPVSVTLPMPVAAAAPAPVPVPVDQ